MSFKDRFNASKNRAEQKAEAKRQKQEAKQKAAEEKERKKLENPKYQAKLTRKAEKARIVEEKRLAKIDIALTEVFNRLLKDDRAVLKAVENNDGYLRQSIGGYNTIGQYFKKAGGFLVDEFGTVTPKQIEQNKAFQAYKKHMDKEGFDIIIAKINDSQDTSVDKIGSTVFLTVGAGLAIAVPPLALLSLLGLSTASTVNSYTSQLTIQIKEKEPAEDANDITQKETHDEEFLDGLNQQKLKEPEKVPVQRNIIR